MAGVADVDVACDVDGDCVRAAQSYGTTGAVSREAVACEGRGAVTGDGVDDAGCSENFTYAVFVVSAM